MLALLPWLGACSAVRLSYSQGPLLAYWWLDGYVDFTPEQAPRAKAALDDWFTWHRATQLPEYVALLGTAQRLAVDNLTPAGACRWMNIGEQRLIQAFDQAVPAMAEIVRSFTPAQLRHIEQRYAKGNDEWQRDFLQTSAAERQEATLKRWVDRLESIYGRLDEAQRALLGEGLADSPFDGARALAERTARQQDILRGLRQLHADRQAERADAASTQALLRSFAAHMSQSPRADYRQYRNQVVSANCVLFAKLHSSTSAAQRQRAVDKLKDWEADFRALISAR